MVNDQNTVGFMESNGPAVRGSILILAAIHPPNRKAACVDLAGIFILSEPKLIPGLLYPPFAKNPSRTSTMRTIPDCSKNKSR